MAKELDAIVRMRAKPECAAEFLELTHEPGYEVKSRLRKGTLVKTGERTYSFIGEWDNFEAIVKARPDMIEDLNRLRPLLEDLGGRLGVAEHIPQG